MSLLRKVNRPRRVKVLLCRCVVGVVLEHLTNHLAVSLTVKNHLCDLPVVVLLDGLRGFLAPSLLIRCYKVGNVLLDIVPVLELPTLKDRLAVIELDVHLDAVDVLLKCGNSVKVNLILDDFLVAVLSNPTWI